MKFDKAIINANVVDSAGVFKGNIYINNGKISAITDPSYIVDVGDETIIDASGLYALPGLVDEHVHMMDPGHEEREDFVTGSKAAAVGGVTTVITHHRTVPPVYSLQTLKEKANYLRNRSIVDFCLKGGASPDNVNELKKMWDYGVTGFKVFTCELHGTPAMLPGNLYELFLELASFNGVALIHCEDDNLTKKNEELLLRAKRKDYLSHCEWRSALAEEIAVDSVIKLAKITGAKVVIAHVSQPIILDKILKARMEGVQIYAETCPHYFMLSKADLLKKGPFVKFAPAVREENDVRKMRQKLDLGFIDTVGSDHCPHTKEDKLKGLKDIWKAPNGIPGVETTLPVLLTLVSQGITSISNVVKVASENPAKIWGLYPQKGALNIGSDADVVLVDLKKREIVAAERIISKCGWSPYEGLELVGQSVMTFVRGKMVASNKKIMVEPGYGKFIVPKRIEPKTANATALSNSK